MTELAIALRQSETPAAFAASSPETIDRVYREARHPLLKLAWSILRDRDAAEDAVQAVFARVMLGHAPPPVTRGYLYRAVRNQALNDLRISSRFVSIETAALAMSSPGAHLQRPSNTDPDGISLREAIRALPSRERQVVRRIAEGFSATEVATELRVTPSTVRSHLARARMLLKRR